MARELTPRHQRWSRWKWHDWDDPDLQALLDRLENGRQVEEVQEWDLTVSRKNQVTLPVAALQKVKVKAGDRLRAVIRARSLILLPHPLSWVDYYAGAAEGLYGHTKEDIDAYIRETRGDWEPPD